MKKSRSRIFLLLLIFICLFTGLAYGERFPVVQPTRDFYVYDEAGLLSKESQKHIVDVNRKIYEQIGAQLVVVSIRDLGNIPKELYGLELFEQWEIGSSSKDNGILILLAADSRQVWIETGYGLEGAFPDSKMKRIIDDYMLPYFKKGDYDSGLINGFNKIAEGIQEEYKIDLDQLQLEVKEPRRSRLASLGLLFIILLLVFIDGRFFRGRLIARPLSRMRYFGAYGPRRSGSRPSNKNKSSGGGGRSGGGGAGGSW